MKPPVTYRRKDTMQESEAASRGGGSFSTRARVASVH
jgi:hypothetical protein